MQRKTRRRKLRAWSPAEVVLVSLLCVSCWSPYMVGSVRWHHRARPMEEEDRRYFRTHPDIAESVDLFPSERLGKQSVEMGYARGGATSISNMEHPPSRKIRRRKQPAATSSKIENELLHKGSALRSWMRFKGSKKYIENYNNIAQGGMINESYPVPSHRHGGFTGGVEPTIRDQWILAYSQMASPYGRGVKDLNVPLYGTFGNHNYGPIGIPIFGSEGDPRTAMQAKLPWNYSTPWEGRGPHPMWPVPPTPRNSSQYNAHALDWMTRKNFNVMDSIQPIGAGDRAAKPATPLPGPAIQLRTGGFGKSIDEYLASRSRTPNIGPGVPFSPPSDQADASPAAEALRFRRTKAESRVAGSETVALGDENNRAPSVIYDPNDPYQKKYINASSITAMFPFDQTGNMASAPYTGFPSQWSSSPWPYSSAGEMPGTSGSPEPHPKWFWMRGEIPRTFPGFSNGNGYYLHGGAFHPHLPERSMMERMSLWPGNVGLMNTKQQNYVPAIAAMRAAAMRPPTTGSDSTSQGSGYTVGGDLQGMRDHYNAVPIEPIPPPGLAGQTQGPSNVGIGGA